MNTPLIPTIEKEKFDAIIIDVGTNYLGRVDPDKIATDVLKIVKICHDYGINDIFVSGITFSDNFVNDILILNNVSISSQFFHNFTFVYHENIIKSVLWKDRIHLNDIGLSKIANNFINAMKRRFPA